MQILDGKAVAQARRQLLKAKIDLLKGKPGLAVVLVGEDKASQVYVGSKIKACQEIGITSVEKRLRADTTERDLKRVIDELNADPTVHGIIVQLPLPRGLDSKKIVGWVSPRKDADCLTMENLGRLWAGTQEPFPAPRPASWPFLNTTRSRLKALGLSLLGEARSSASPWPTF